MCGAGAYDTGGAGNMTEGEPREPGVYNCCSCHCVSQNPHPAKLCRRGCVCVGRVGGGERLRERKKTRERGEKMKERERERELALESFILQGL